MLSLIHISLVQPAADGFCELLQSVLSGFTTMPGNEQTQQMLRYSNDGFPKVVDYLYDHFDEFKPVSYTHLDDQPHHVYERGGDGGR